jgi:protein-tyrosine kinase
MLIPKASHLVERVAERLLRAGALDGSAAQLLRPAGASASEEPEPSAVTSKASSLFAAAPATHPLATRPLATQARPFSDAVFGEAAIAADAAAADVPAEADVSSEPVAGPVSRAMPLAPATARDPVDDAAFGQLATAASIDAVSLERAGMVDWSRTRSRISEEFRLVQRQILRSAFGPGAEPGFSNLLMVTSARPGEGKSFMSLNMAGSIARQGDNNVLLVDADSKRDSICYSLGLAQARGLLDLAANPRLDPAPLIVKSPIERLSILPVGRERERSAELFSTKEMTRVIQSLGRRYADRLLILDAPPCLSTSDPALLAQVVGQVLFVVEADRTQRDEVEASLDLIQACPTITMVLNKQQISSRYTFGAYSSYYSS